MRTRFLSLVMATLLLAGCRVGLGDGARLVGVVTLLAVVASWVVVPTPDRRWFVVAVDRSALCFSRTRHHVGARKARL